MWSLCGKMLAQNCKIQTSAPRDRRTEERKTPHETGWTAYGLHKNELAPTGYLRTLPGATPTIFLNTRQKYAWSWKPVSLATSFIVLPLVLRSVIASWMR